MPTPSELQSGEQQLTDAAPDLLTDGLPVVVEAYVSAASERHGGRARRQRDVDLKDSLQRPGRLRIPGIGRQDAAAGTNQGFAGQVVAPSRHLANDLCRQARLEAFREPDRGA